MRIHWFPVFLSLLSLHPCISQVNSPEKSRVLDSIPVNANSSENFALYLPGEYSENELSAILFIFDPAGRGRLGVENFIEIAEKYNFILICSNQVKNGPYETNLAMTERLFEHVFSHFNIDPNRIYTTGFSGGSRLAMTIAVLSGAIQGVVGCGAGFSGNTMYLPTQASNFSFAGLVGERDMNYQEMFKATQWLSTIGLPNELFTYEDGHNWPPSEQLMRAFDWMELQAFKKGIKKKDDDVIYSTFEKDMRIARQFEEEEKMVPAVTEYKRILRNYQGYFNLDTLTARVQALKKTKSFKTGNRDRERIVNLEDTLSARYLKKFQEDLSAGLSSDNFKWWQKQIGKLDTDYVNSDRFLLQQMGRRLRYQLYALAVESFENHVRNMAIEKAIYCARFLVLQEPKNPNFHFIAARGFATLNLIDQSLSHLEQAVENGWDDRAALADTKEFLRLRQNPRFRELLLKF